MVVSEEELNRLFRVRRTVMQMLRDRGYLVTDLEINISKNDFRLQFSGNVRRRDFVINKAKKQDSSDQIYVFFPEESKVTSETIRTYANRTKSENVFRAILVVRQKLTFFAQKSIAEISSNFHLEFEVFQESELLVNITDNALVPKHKVLTDSEKKTLLEKYTVKETQLPRMQVTDPVARYFGMKRGQVVRISRNSETSGKYITYRYVA
ncbi:DNA-directed RNA polymerases II and IV subunit 5A-like [Neltuma alba]|uniref:DNA-directed RNA polymerases II and IV subunit 5A-like n=1 Tax=Neltuma alba TaxID=207710 RepID=UPI0010A46114|nr:DNA-directed RNA polymerases II and IV subunit 5A-like [Prosopis alba]